MFALPDRQSLGILDTSRELLDQGRYSEAVLLLATILEAKDDYFFMAATQADEPDAGRQYRSLQNEARSVLSDMPPAAQEAYELQFGAVARRLLDEALAERDIEQILEVQRRYFGSTAGYEATYLLGYFCLNQGRFLTAMRHFQTLRSSRAAARYEPAIAEIADAVHLVALDPKSGELLWSQQLALISPDRRDSTIRRTSGISPSCAAGILICPTGMGAVVAVDLSARHLLWAYGYPATPPAGGMIDVGGTWADSCAVISDRHVLITPAEAAQMHCLDLLDGKYRWSLDRGNGAFLAGVDRGVAVVVGSSQLTPTDSTICL
jgi:outer membrane protein assembly factor BamB